MPLQVVRKPDQVPEYISLNVASEHIGSVNKFADRLKSNKQLGD